MSSKTRHFAIFRILRSEYAQPYPGLVHINLAALGTTGSRTPGDALQVAQQRYPEFKLQLCVEEILK